MIRDRDDHLDSLQLEAYLEDRLESPDEEVFVAHLDTCDTCRKSLETAAGSHGWWKEVETLDERQLGTKLGDLEDSESQSLRDHRLRRQLSHIMAPTDDPRMLGRIGKYEAIGVIGRGGTGIVLKAFDPSLGRFVALKVLAPELSITGAARERFAREARAAAAVTHENVIPIHAVSDFMGHGYIVMQYVPGNSLEHRLRQRGPLQIAEILRLSMQIASALDAAHQQGLVHRDIKPANILLEEGIDRPLVTDFGLARVANDASLTNSGVIAGTPNYMSPEQASGNEIDARSDLFSLGSVMYAMCVGCPPFRSESIVAVLRRVSEADPSSIRNQNSSVPVWLEAFIFKLLAKQPDHRFESAGRVAVYLSQELAHLQNPMTHAEPMRRWWTDSEQRNARWWMLLLVVLVLGAISLGWAGYQQIGKIDNQTNTETVGAPTTQSPTPQTMSPEAWNAEFSQVLELIMQLELLSQPPRFEPDNDPWADDASKLRQMVQQLEVAPSE